MPALPIIDHHGRVRTDGVLVAFAVMLFPGPHQEALRQSFIARCIVDAAAKPNGADALLLDCGLLRRALDASPHPVSSQGNREPWRSGEIAGMQLAWMYSM